MSSMRKLERRVEVAGERYTTACADLVAARLSVAGEPDIEERPDIAGLKRRAAAYRVQMEAAERHLETAITSREVAA